MEKQENTFSESDIAKAVKRIAASVVSDYDDLSQLVLVGVMDGAVFLLVDLMRELREQESGERIQMATARNEELPGYRAERRAVHFAALTEPHQETGCSDSRRHSKHWGNVCMSKIKTSGNGR